MSNIALQDEEIVGKLTLLGFKCMWHASNQHWLVEDMETKACHAVNASTPRDHWNGLIEFFLKVRNDRKRQWGNSRGTK